MNATRETIQKGAIYDVFGGWYLYCDANADLWVHKIGSKVVNFLNENGVNHNHWYGVDGFGHDGIVATGIMSKSDAVKIVEGLKK